MLRERGKPNCNLLSVKPNDDSSKGLTAVLDIKVDLRTYHQHHTDRIEDRAQLTLFVMTGPLAASAWLAIQIVATIAPAKMERMNLMSENFIVGSRLESTSMCGWAVCMRGSLQVKAILR
jgi:hypothetical protein